MTILLANTAIPSQSEPSLLVNEFTLTNNTNDNGFLRDTYGAISPDDDYSGVNLYRLTVHFSASVGDWYYILMLPGENWLQDNIKEVKIQGVFTGIAFPESTGASAGVFMHTAGRSLWRWSLANESFFVQGNQYDCSISWAPPA